MTIHHHPSEELLLDYATGALGETWSLAIATHMALCPVCRSAVADMEALGGSLLADLAPEPVAQSAIDAVMARLDEDVEAEAAMPVSAPSRDGAAMILPEPLRGYVGGDVSTLQWQRLGMGASQLIIPTADDGATARLLRIPAGRPMPTHGHRGLELTLVLAGAFSDATGDYGRGDLQEADDSLEHKPHAAPGEDCICLAVTDAPLRFKSVAARLLQPLLDI